MNESEVAAFVHQLRATFTQLDQLPQPTIAALDGAALGGGLELALCCDLRIAGPKSLVGLPETKLAIIPGYFLLSDYFSFEYLSGDRAGGTQRLARLVGASRAKELIFTGRRLKAQEALDMGIVNRVGSESGFTAALELAREILPQGPIALRMAKLAVDRGVQVDLQSGLAFEQTCYAQVIPTQDRLEGLKAFREKRSPQYTGK